MKAGGKSVGVRTEEKKSTEQTRFMIQTTKAKILIYVKPVEMYD